MPLKVFLTGVTGYIGGDGLYALTEAHPELEYTALVRQGPKVAQVAAHYPKLRLVYGDLASSELIEDEASKADIVIHWASADDEPSVHAIAKGFISKPRASAPSYWLHNSGTGTLLYHDIDRNLYGEDSTKIYDDWDGLNEVTSLPEHAPHVRIERLLLKYGTEHAERIRTAIVSPPCIYGEGRGPGNQRSIQIPSLAKGILEQGQGLQIGAGKTHWNGIHVADLSNLYVKFVDDIIAGGKKATWGKEGYYFVEDHDIVFGKLGRDLAVEAKKQGFIESDEVKSVLGEDANSKIHPHALALLGANSKSKAVRARKLLGWSPSMSDLSKEVPRVVLSEAKLLGKVPGHAAKAAGTA